MRLSVENWRIRNIGYPALFPSTHRLPLTPQSPIFPDKLPEVKTQMGAAEVWVARKLASAGPVALATLGTLPDLKFACLPLHPRLLK